MRFGSHPGIWLAAGLCLSAIGAAPAGEPQTVHHFDDAAQDSHGSIWAIGRQLYLYNGKQWSEMPSGIPEDDDKGHATPKRLAPMKDGTMACLWQLSGSSIAVTCHTPTSAQFLGRAPGRISMGGLRLQALADSHNRVWITNAGPDIYRADAAGGLQVVYSIKPGQLLDVNDLKAHYGDVQTSEDGRGRVWVWTDSWSGGMNGAALCGFLIFDGTNVTQQEKLGGVAGQRYSFLKQEDEKHMWLAVLKQGLYEVDVDTLTGKPVPEPAPGAFQWIKSVFSAGNDLYVIASHPGDIFANTIWRRRESKWTTITDDVDGSFNSSLDFSRPWLQAGSDVLLATHDAAPLYLPADGPPLRLDWQYGFPADEARKLFRLTDGSWFVLDGRGHAFQRKLDLPPKLLPTATRRVTELQVSRGWATDADGCVWTTLANKLNVLSQWDGSRWIDHPFPPELNPEAVEDIGADSRGRIWIFPQTADFPLAYYDSHAGAWSKLLKLPDGFQALEDDPPVFIGKRPYFFVPDFSADHRRIAYRSPNWQVCYFDGKTWAQFTRTSIEGDDSHSHGTTFGTPFFAQDDHLCVTIELQTWRMDDQGRWDKAAVEDKFPDIWAGPTVLPPHKTPIPEGCVTEAPESIFQDNHGAYWLTARGVLYKCAWAECVPVFAKDEQNPFQNKRLIHGAWVDMNGNAFLETDNGRRVMIAPKSAPPKATVAVTRTAVDSIAAQFSADSPLKVRFRWHLDGGPWQSTPDNSLALDSLPGGSHTLAVIPIDEELESGAQVVAKFEIHVDTAQQIASLIKRLADPDFEKRKSAVTALARQPATALPALKAARQSADEDQRWWIEAAIEEIERQKH